MAISSSFGFVDGNDNSFYRFLEEQIKLLRKA
jgi:hypothetical protein